MVLGCTEIPLGIQGRSNPGCAGRDTIDALARAAIAWVKRSPSGD